MRFTVNGITRSYLTKCKGYFLTDPNVIESAFATIRHRSDRAKGCVTRATMLAFIYKLGIAAQNSWRRLRGFEHLAKVVAGVKFRDGVEIKPNGRRKMMHQPTQVAA